MRLNLRLQQTVPSKSARLIRSVGSRLPFAYVGPIAISVKPDLTVYRGQLLSGQPHRGDAVHAAGYIHERRIVLETQLLRSAASVRLILTHELFHFFWPRLGNPARAIFIRLLKQELAAGARGELGESSWVSKNLLLRRLSQGRGDRQFREYVCESFCDTGAFFYSGVKACEHFTLAERWAARRRVFFQQAIDWEARCI